MKKRVHTPLMLLSVFVLTLAILILPMFQADAEKSAQDKMDEAQDKIQECDDKLAQLKEDKETTETEKQLLNEQSVAINEKITLLKADIEAQNEAIIQKQAEHDAKVIRINNEEALLDNRLMALYMSRDDGMLGPMLGATNYTDAIVIADGMNRVANADTAFLGDLSVEKAEIEAEQKELDEAMAQLEADKLELETTQQKLAWNIQQKDKDLTALEADKQATQADRDAAWADYQAAIAEAEKEFGSGNAMGDEFISGKFLWPVPGHNRITSGYGYRSFWLGNTYYSDFHTGIDISGNHRIGAPIVAAADGYVTAAVYGSTGYGIRVYVDHGGGFVTRYAHCSALYVGQGDYVTAGQTIAALGSTGFSTGPHLHYEIRQNGQHTNPLIWYS